ncbi:unnamed protein product [Coffea canephora]|uniref:Expansin-like EG45 domain-containing protein n=1 Tax=Coffea canephora TaxID=49390 RepID=A0A068U417_COFCA|nr:unnamed protein product [Coffea canephora]
MATINQIFLFIGILVSLVLAAHADCGSATCYTLFNPSACYGYDAPTGLIASASPEIWENRAACGKRYRITCTAGTNLGVPEPCSGL